MGSLFGGGGGSSTAAASTPAPPPPPPPAPAAPAPVELPATPALPAAANTPPPNIAQNASASRAITANQAVGGKALAGFAGTVTGSPLGAPSPTTTGKALLGQ